MGYHKPQTIEGSCRKGNERCPPAAAGRRPAELESGTINTHAVAASAITESYMMPHANALRRLSNRWTWPGRAAAGLSLCGAACLLVSCELFVQRPPSAVPKGPVTPVDMAAADDYVAEAEAALNTGDKDAALAAFAAAIEENPRIVRAHMGMAEIYKERQQWPEAEVASRKWVELEPRSYDARYLHGFVLHQLNRLLEAIREYRQALIIEPNSHEANLNIATAYLQLSQAVEALPFAERAVQVQPNHGPSRANLGVIYAAVGNHAKAVENYQAALELMEPSPELMLNMVESLRKLQRYPEMVNTLEALIRMQPSADAYERLGYATFKMREYERSESSYRSALQLDKNYYPAMNGLAVNLLNDYIRSNRTDNEARQEALDLLRRSLQLNQDQPKIVELLSRYGR